MNYRVRYADDDQFPIGHDWIIRETPGETTLYLRTSMCELPISERERILGAAWLGFMEARRVIPKQRISA